ncbi:MAG: DsbA family protein [Gemmatimonadota bacterium]|nr:DsbA family protein [Gemmatimonadota bacterium]
MIPIQVNRVGALVVVALALACAPSNSTKQAAESSTAIRTDTAAVIAPAATPKDSDGVRADLARIQGSPAASVWVIEVSDFQCPFCKQWHDQTYQQLRDEFVKTGKVRLAYINFPLAQHIHAWPAAESAMCAGAQGKFWEMHDVLFANQGKWEALPSPAAFFDSLARATGVDIPRWRQCVQSGKMKPWIQADHDRAQTAGAASTPSFMIGDKILVGAQPIEILRSAIDSALAKARKTTP